MHIRQFVFLFASFASFAVLGCNSSHLAMPMGDAGPAIGDSGPVINDAGPTTTIDVTPHDATPPGGVITAGDGEWHEVSRVWIGHDQDLSSICLELDGDPADIEDVAIGTYGSISHRTFIHGIRLGGFADGQRVCVELDEHIRTLPLIDSRVAMLVLVRIPADAMSGNSFRVGITGADRIIDDAHYHADIETLWSNRFEIR